jgi:hypothetical protein
MNAFYKTPLKQAFTAKIKSASITSHFIEMPAGNEFYI